MNEVRLTVFPGSLEYRFAAPSRRGSEPIPLAQILERLQGIDAEHCQRLVLGGESPTKHPQFVELLKECGRRGFKNVVVESDAEPFARKGMATLLGRLGVKELVLVLGGLHQNVHEAVLADGSSQNQALAGLQRALAAGSEGGPGVYVVVPLLRINVDDVEPLLDWTLGLPGRLRGFLLALPEVNRVPAESRDRLLPYAVQAQVAARIFRKCQGHNVEYGFTSKRGLTPCAAGGALDRFATVLYDRFQYFQHTPHVLERESIARIEACRECSLVETCPGIETTYLEQFGESEFAPIPLEVSMDWKLRRINQREQFEYRNISPFSNDSPVGSRGLIRINGHCNMSCSFCFVDRTVPDFDLEQLCAEIDAMVAGGTRHLVISGGEPTIHPQLAELIRFAKSRQAFDVIEMQSNGVKCADLEYSRELVVAGLNKVTVSLHSIDPEHSDKITRLPNAFGKTLQALHNFRRLGVVTQVAHVITKMNYQELPETVRFLRNEFPAAGGHLSICFAIAQEISDLVFQWVAPRFFEIKPFVADALDYCLETGIGFGGMIGQGGYPPCMLDGDLRYYTHVLDKVFKSEDSSEQFYKAEKCKECCFDSYCLGPRRSYIEHYGEDEIKPFTSDLLGARDSKETTAASMTVPDTSI